MRRFVRGLPFLGLLVAAPLAAQSQFGLVGGFVSSNMKFTNENVSFEPKSRSGFAVGLSMMGAGGGTFTFAPEALYVMKGASVDLGGDARGEFKTTYVEVPLLFRASINSTSKMRPFVFLGPSLAYQLSCKVSGENGDGSISGNCSTIGENDGDEPLKKFDYGAMFGAGAHFDRLSVSVRYDMGLANLNDNGDGNLSIKNKALMVMLGISF